MNNVVTCGKCGKEMIYEGNKRRMICPSCGTISLIIGDNGILSYMIEPKVTRSEAIVDIKRWFHAINMPSDLAKNSKLEGLSLFFIPILRIEGEVQGWIYGKTPVMKETVRYEGKRKVFTKHKIGEEPYEKILKQTHSWEGLGLELPMLGTETLKNKLRQIFSTSLIFTTKDDVKKLGTIYETTPTRDEVISKAESMLVAKTVIFNCQGQFEVKYVDLSVVKAVIWVIYYPIWHLKYSYQGRLFQVTLDATNHHILYGRAPLDNSAGVASLLFLNMSMTLFSYLIFKNSSIVNIVILSIIATLILTFGMNIYDISFLGEVKLYEERITDTGSDNVLQKMWFSIRSIFKGSRRSAPQV